MEKAFWHYHIWLPLYFQSFTVSVIKHAAHGCYDWNSKQKLYRFSIFLKIFWQENYTHIFSAHSQLQKYCSRPPCSLTQSQMSWQNKKSMGELLSIKIYDRYAAHGYAVHFFRPAADFLKTVPDIPWSQIHRFSDRYNSPWPWRFWNTMRSRQKYHCSRQIPVSSDI